MAVALYSDVAGAAAMAFVPGRPGALLGAGVFVAVYALFGYAAWLDAKRESLLASAVSFLLWILVAIVRGWPLGG